MCDGLMAWGTTNWRRKSITVAGLGRESEGAIVAMKRRNFRGAKDPCRTNVSIKSKEIRLDSRPTTEDAGNSEPESTTGRIQK